jgi:outer membrane protein OmpA-like peptidoglycan-associated protein
MGKYGSVVDFGPEDFNILLSDNRAKSVANVLIEKGVPKDRVVTKANGETKPRVPNTTPEGRSANRRVQLNVLF